MRIAIHAADLDHKRIDGTRVYILNMLKYFGDLDKKDTFFLYHKNKFNSHLTPPNFKNYFVKKISFPFFWTQLCLALELFRERPDVLWMPMHNIPLLRSSKIKAVVTIHDLAFKIFPEYFPKKELLKLNLLCNNAIKYSQHIIAISETTKEDILKFYPEIAENKISVVYHGFDKELFQQKVEEKNAFEILEHYKLQPQKYLLYVGAIQPRKNLNTLIEAFEKVKKRNHDLRLVLAGEKAWQVESTLEKISSSEFKDDIIITGTIPFGKLPVLYQNSCAFVFPSLYEGFGIPVLEAMASGAPTILAKNSSLLEVGGDAATYFETKNSDSLAERINEILLNGNLRDDLVRKGKKHCQNFSWQKSAQETLEVLHS